MQLSSLFLAASATVGTSAYLHVNLEREVTRRPHRLEGRDSGDGYFEVPIPQNADKMMYKIKLAIGTPPQTVSVQLDTGSADLWVPTDSNPVCVQGECAEGSFDPARSTSYDLTMEDGFNISYFSAGDFAAGDWSHDTVTLEDGTSIPAQLFGAANEGPNPLGVMGLSLTYGQQDPLPQSGAAGTVLDSLSALGTIGRRSFGMYLDDVQASKGSLLFGAVDTTKYTGDLVALPLQGDETGQVYGYDVALTSVSFTDETGTTTQLSPDGFSDTIKLDSGTTDVWINSRIFTRLALGFGAVKNEYGYFVPCSLKNAPGSINYELGGADGITISVPLSQIFGSEAYEDSADRDDAAGCYFGFNPMETSGGMLGDSFLRSAYVVHDMDNAIVAVAQAALGQMETSQIITMPASETTIPGATRTGTATISLADDSSETYTPPANLLATTLEDGTPTFHLAASNPSGNGAVATKPEFTFLSVIFVSLGLYAIMLA